MDDVGDRDPYRIDARLRGLRMIGRQRLDPDGDMPAVGVDLDAADDEGTTAAILVDLVGDLLGRDQLQPQSAAVGDRS